MKLFFISILALALQTTALAQYMQINWQTCYMINPTGDYPSGVIPTGDGYLVSGTMFPPTSHAKVFLFKTDLQGNVLWDKTFGGNIAEASRAKLTPSGDGNYLLYAHTHSTSGDITYNPYPGSASYWVIKIDSDGNKLLDKIYGGNGTDEAQEGIPTSDGGFAVFGRTTSNDGDVSAHYGSWDMWMVKADSLGEVQLDFTIGGIGMDFAHAIIQTSDGGYLLGGSAQVAGGGNYECEPYNWYAESVLFKIDSNANIEWQRCYSSSHHNGINAVLETGDGYVVVGFNAANDGDMDGCGYHPGFHPNGEPTTDIWLAKLDFSGDIVWQRCLGGSGSEYSRNLFETAEGDYLIFGSTNSHDGDVSGNNSYPHHSYSDVWVVKVSSDGELLWQQCIGGLLSEDNPAVSQVNFNTYILAVSSQSGISGNKTCALPGHHTWVIELTDLTVGITEQPVKDISIKVYPNPATTEFWLQLPENLLLAQAQIELISPTGNLLYKAQPSGHFHKIETAHLPKGLYLVRLWDGKQWFGEKVVVR